MIFQKTMSFDEFCGRYRKGIYKEKALQIYNIEGYDSIFTVANHMMGTDEDPRAVYRGILVFFVDFRDAIEPVSKEDTERITRYLKSIYELESVQTVPITAATKREDHFRLVHDLDLKRKEFKQAYFRNYKLYDKASPDFMIFIALGRTIFMSKGFQPPYRTSPEKALEDTMGMSDLYLEFMEECGIVFNGSAIASTAH